MRPSLRLADLAEFAAEADFAEHGQVGGKRLVADRAHHGEADAEVEPRFAELHPTGRRRVDVLVADRDA